MDVCTDVCVDVVWMCTVFNWSASDVYMWVLIGKVVHCIFSYWQEGNCCPFFVMHENEVTHGIVSLN